jgi:DNA-binding transcriptional MerR regulator
LPAPPRSDGNRRQYDKNDLSRLTFIRHARELGFEIDAIRTLLSLQDNPDQSCEVADGIARARLSEVETRISSLLALQAELQRMVEHCAHGRVADCRVIETLADDTHDHGRLG